MVLDALDRALINGLQGGFPLSDRPYAEVGERFGLSEDDVIARIGGLLDRGVLSRFGPMYHAERLGGGLALAAMKVPEGEFEAVNEAVNALDAVAHNYARDHAFNMWFVLATETPEGIDAAARDIEAATGYPVYLMPKIEEYFVGLRFEA
ncbi:MAG: AsnC family transcriptional regulator [Rhodobacterales bacterium]|nr:AsnC family transcriptional regulator [Rhodobacterales bacterium]